MPFVGVIVLLYFFIIDSENDNQYGPYPKDGPVASTPRVRAPGPLRVGSVVG